MDRMAEALRRYGQTVVLSRKGEETETRAFLQPWPERGEQIPQNPTSLGWVDRRLWLYLGREALAPGDQAQWNGLRLRVRSSRPYAVGDSPHHWWAVLEAAREEAET